MLRTMILVAGCLAASAAVAGQQQADQCAAGLSGDSKTIYDAVAPTAASAPDLRAAITDATKSLVMAGKVSRSSAKGAAEAAGACLAHLKS
ncbi:hypothetical protein EDC22_106159 [Tepidamorphus gemmatus]|jgi:hypothetical protein|uniref:UrcA family protein n=1 Tax=Tepidamorphus gemmatus TaxID=747076 RepID=A0A4R3M8U4_9HYPH|nr:hypothetical protein [Tepidamorphus gemmatus]TCT09964.1 hypothetical protein EDC22_106159 [Tepidamorphus gemmatus]